MAVAQAIRIGGHLIGPSQPTFIVAELGGNHNGSIDEAFRLIHEAKNAGADAIKTQCFTPDTITLKSDAPAFQIIEGPWAGRTLYDLYTETAMPREWHRLLKSYANTYGLEYFASVFSAEDADFMESIGVPAYKIASFELVDLPLIVHVAQRGKPVILSTGMASPADIYDAYMTVESFGVESIWLHCVSSYPAPLEETNLWAMRQLAFEPPCGFVGVSDHSKGNIVPIAAVALGACVVEKHLTLSKDGGPDAAFSLLASEFADMVRAVRNTEKAITPYEKISDNIRFRRSLFVIRDISQGETFTEDNVKSIRPADGLAPRELPYIVGRHAAQNIKRGTPLSWGLIA
jgi:pseudaminic acid synthase